LEKQQLELKDLNRLFNGECDIMNYDDLSDFVFEFINEFYLHEASGIRYGVSDEVANERLDICKTCKYHDAKNEVCKECGCYLPQKTYDPFDSCPIQKWGVDKRQWNEVNYEYILSAMRERTGDYE